MRGPYRKRRIHEPPAFKSFKPGGVPAKLLKTITFLPLEGFQMNHGVRLKISYLKKNRP